MIKIKKGSIIPENIKIKEEYKVENDTIVLNIDVDKINKLLKSFVKIQKEELFLFIEVPTNINEEKENYTDVYYLDGISINEIDELLNMYGDILINDGLCEFGFGVKSFNEEIMSLKYNMITIYSKENVNKYIDLLNELKINKTIDFKSAWDYFTEENPGISKLYEKEKQTVYDIIEILKEKGLYLGERKKVK